MDERAEHQFLVNTIDPASWGRTKTEIESRECAAGATMFVD